MSNSSQRVADFFNGKVVFITGAGSGIGRATALMISSFGAKLLLSDINQSSLDTVAAECISAGAVVAESYVCDVSKYESMQQIADQIHAKHLALDILINNAGVGLGGSFMNTSIDDWRWIMGINLMGVVHGCKCFIPNMIKSGNGHVVNTASMIGYYAAPDMSAYAASKHAVMGLSESLRSEMKEHNIGVSVICPGVVNTNIINNGRMLADDEGKKRLAASYVKRDYGPELVAKAIVDAIVKNKAIVPVSPEAWLIYTGKRFFPSVVSWASTSKMAQKLRL